MNKIAVNSLRIILIRYRPFAPHIISEKMLTNEAFEERIRYK